MLKVTENIAIPLSEIEVSAIRSQGAGGQNVNKVSTAIHIRFNVRASIALSDEEKVRIMGVNDRRLSKDGVIVIKSQRYRSQDKNRSDALERLADMIRKSLMKKKPRKPTKPTKKSQQKRLDDKTKRGRLKESRGKVSD